MGCLGSCRQGRLAWVGCPNRCTTMFLYSRDHVQLFSWILCKNKTIVLKLGLLTTAFVFILIQVILIYSDDVQNNTFATKNCFLATFHISVSYIHLQQILVFSKTEENLITPFAVSPFSFAAQLEFVSLIQPIYFSGSRRGLSSQPPLCFGGFFVSFFFSDTFA